VTLAGLATISDVDLRLMADSLPHIVWMGGPDGFMEYLNRHGAIFTGLAEGVSHRLEWLALVHPDDVDEARLAWEQAIRAHRPFHVDGRLRRFDGVYRWHGCRGVPIDDGLGCVGKWLVTATDVDDAKMLEADLRLADRMSAETLSSLEMLQAKAPVGFGFVDRDFRFVRLNETLAAINGSTVAEQVGQLVASVVPELWPQIEPLYRRVLDSGEAILDLEVEISAADPTQTRRWLTSYYPVPLHDEIIGIGIVLVDVTERLAAERVRRLAESRFEISFEQAAIGAVISDLDGLPIRVNSAVCTILGRPADQLVGRRWTEYTHPDDLPLGMQVLTRIAEGYDTYEDERRYVLPDGAIVWALTNVTLVRDDMGEPQYFFMQLQDATARKKLELELAHQALHDSLTGLPNRALLTDRLIQGLAGSRRRRSQLGVIFIDIDEFKVINDSLGHSTGDDLLTHAAARISEAIRPGDTVARFGGDEFVVVCDDITAFEAEQIAERILEALSQPWHTANRQLHLTASLGIAIADTAATPESLLRDSDAAMYRAKERGKARIELFDDSLRSKVERRLATASQLHRALDRQEFVINYQPVIDLTTGAMVSVEALLRWNHPTRGLVPPGEFIPIAEETGLIVPIGAVVLEQACQQLVEWQRLQASLSDEARLSVAVNLSVRQLLAPDVAGLVEGVLKRVALPPTSLCLELTESVFMEDTNYFGRTLAGLKDLGVGLAIDDFGTGYSSLSYLKRFPVDAVKVDRGFVDGLGTDPHNTALVAAIIAMAGALGLAVTAEGVETLEQLRILRQLGVPFAQGFYFARPMPANEITQLVRDGHRWTVD
jgi:diguanylate cyclase (GGDEF)-like protein/PAS domain S-box-containing protein